MIEDDTSKYPAQWSDLKLYEAIEDQMLLAQTAPSLPIRRGHLGNATALLKTLSDRTQLMRRTYN